MKRTKLLFITLILVTVLMSSCSAATVSNSDEQTTSQTTNIEDTAAEEDMTEEKEILAAYETMQQAMIEKDIETLDSIVVDGTTFTHMNGKQQTKAEFFGEIADGTLNYYSYKLKDCEITIDGDNATLTGKTTLRAKVYGIPGVWTLDTNAHLIKVDGQWKFCN